MIARRLMAFSLVGALCACGPAAVNAPSPSATAASKPPEPGANGAGPSAPAATPSSQTEASSTPAATEDDRFADCQAIVALQTKLEARFLWVGFDTPQQTQETLQRKASEYEALGLVHPKPTAAARELSVAYRESAGRVPALHAAMGAAAGDDLAAAQKRWLEALNPSEPLQQLAHACDAPRVPSNPSRRATCGLLAGASYQSVRFAVFGTDHLASPAIKAVSERANQLGPEATSFASAQRKRHDALNAAAAGWKNAPAPEKDALQVQRVSLLVSSVEATSKELRQLCPGFP